MDGSCAPVALDKHEAKERTPENTILKFQRLERKMRTKFLKKGMLFAGAAIALSGANAADVTIGADFASAYVFRGATLDRDPVLQPYVEVEGLELAGHAITFGTWANYDPSDDEGGSGEFDEIDYYASIDLFAGFGLGYTEYTYPGSDVDSDREAALSYGTEVGGVELGLAGYFMVGGYYAGSIYIEGTADYGIELSESLTWSFGASVGYVAASEARDGADETPAGFSNYTLSTGLAYAVTEATEIGASAKYIGEMDDDVLETDKNFVATVGVSHSF